MVPSFLVRVIAQEGSWGLAEVPGQPLQHSVQALVAVRRFVISGTIAFWQAHLG